MKFSVFLDLYKKMHLNHCPICTFSFIYVNFISCQMSSLHLPIEVCMTRKLSLGVAGQNVELLVMYDLHEESFNTTQASLL